MSSRLSAMPDRSRAFLLSVLPVIVLGIGIAPDARAQVRTHNHDGAVAFETPDFTVRVGVNGHRFGGIHLETRRDAGLGEKTLEMPEAFVIVLKDKSILRSTEMSMTRTVSTGGDTDQVLSTGGSNETAASERRSCWEFTTPQVSANVRWCAVTRTGAEYFRQELTITANGSDLPISEVRLLEFADPSAYVDGTVKGSPIVSGDMFFGFEHPLSSSVVKSGVVTASLFRELPLKSGQSVRYSSVIGDSKPGQLRRTVLAYLENERPRRYKPFLHYNSWFDLGYGERFGEVGALDRINAFGQQLVEKRGVQLDSFLFDDGWDDPHTLWGFDSGFPNGFVKAGETAAKYHAGIGVWMSPWGGYDKQKLERIAYGRQHGYEILNNGYALSGPKYYEQFQKTCLEMIDRYHVNQFKFDGTGNAGVVFPGSAFDSDFDAAIHLIERLRKQKPGIFINLTTGTTPSPFWLFYADSIWRGGEDHDFTGVGTPRQRWITYRDAQTYKNIVRAGPLFPLNSLMLHGIVYAKQAKDLGDDPKNDFADEVHSYFGTGTQLQELYITPSLMTPTNWNTLAEAAKWSRDNAETLKDVHWVGGDPNQLQVYGWAAWSPKKGILTLRNPSSHSQSFDVDVAKVFELPAGAPVTYSIRNVWNKQSDSGQPRVLQAGKAAAINLAPFEVITFEAVPHL